MSYNNDFASYGYSRWAHFISTMSLIFTHIVMYCKILILSKAGKHSVYVYTMHFADLFILLWTRGCSTVRLDSASMTMGAHTSSRPGLVPLGDIPKDSTLPICLRFRVLKLALSPPSLSLTFCNQLISSCTCSAVAIL